LFLKEEIISLEDGGEERGGDEDGSE